ncbi:hypothetical protein BDR06DRAFT_1000392 [Suillus hirtellus]|nr:hypothetical protein BDR06DRAFT_1000392 [Suillus hirtellus]
MPRFERPGASKQCKVSYAAFSTPSLRTLLDLRFRHTHSFCQTSAGLATPAAAVVLMGKGEAVALLLVVFMTMTLVVSATAVLSIGQVWPMHKFLRTHSRLDHLPYLPAFAGGGCGDCSCIMLRDLWMGYWATILHQANKRRPSLGENIPHYVQCVDRYDKITQHAYSSWGGAGE